jgi:hypothetical protein
MTVPTNSLKSTGRFPWGSCHSEIWIEGQQVAVSRPSHYIKINVCYPETLASAADLEQTFKYGFILE